MNYGNASSLRCVIFVHEWCFYGRQRKLIFGSCFKCFAISVLAPSYTSTDTPALWMLTMFSVSVHCIACVNGSSTIFPANYGWRCERVNVSWQNHKNISVADAHFGQPTTHCNCYCHHCSAPLQPFTGGDNFRHRFVDGPDDLAYALFLSTYKWTANDDKQNFIVAGCSKCFGRRDRKWHTTCVNIISFFFFRHFGSTPIFYMLEPGGAGQI